MGREWYFKWATKKATRSTTTGGGGSGGGGSSGDGVEQNSTPTPAVSKMAAAVTRGGGGCMNGVFHLFDFPHFKFCSYPNHEVNLSVVQPTSIKEFETPSRKSMDSSSKEAKRDTKLKLAIKTLTKEEDSFSEGARTPNLVARLMGLDILPELSNSNITTPRSSSHYSQSLLSTTTTTTTTPASSSRVKTRPRTSKLRTTNNSTRHVLDVLPRLSLEFNKDNCSIVREMESSRHSCSAISTKKIDEGDEEESKSPRYYAQQVMNQVKENIVRRRTFGVDITNNKPIPRRDEHLVLPKPKKAYKVNKENSKPKLEILKSKAIQEKKHRMHELNKRVVSTIRSSKKSSPNLTLDSTTKKNEEQFIRLSAMRANFEDKCKRNTQLSTQLMVPPNKLPHKQVALLKARSSKLVTSTRPRLSCNPSHGRGRRSKDTTTTSKAEFHYVSRILKDTGIDENTPGSLLDPSFIHSLEITHYSSTSNLIPFAEEGDAIVLEIEREIMDSLIQEIAVFMFCFGMRRYSMLRYMSHKKN